MFREQHLNDASSQEKDGIMKKLKELKASKYPEGKDEDDDMDADEDDEDKSEAYDPKKDLCFHYSCKRRAIALVRLGIFERRPFK